ncbi:putative HAD superfamily protein [Novosphingobium sp. PhB57]|uniref:phosphoribosyltransferase n=1 Tax=Novosphingobium sp. PhB57 TaxID=2485107 RepID=UPI00104C787D|nr:phosphoribosyltransferase family protein [Novosphingobium sp. PhB57]TCU58640.1 putative HAD superfamily protein [Novosphingobium sp. PhB57]
MEYRSFADLAETVFFNAHAIPEDVDLIVGVPRSGLLPANLLAVQLHKPLLDLESYLEGRTPTVGRTARETIDEKVRPRRVLIVDDSIASGESMRAVRERVQAAAPQVPATYLAVYGTRAAHEDADLIFEAVPSPRIFEWNLMRHKRLADACFDIDGILCHDPHSSQNDDGEKYRDFLLTAKPLLRANVPIKHLVTSRLEKYRPETEQWLAANGVKYENLWMLDLPSAEERRRQRAHASFKASVYIKTGAGLFVESEDKQAQEIAQLSERPVLSIEGQRMVWPGNATAARRSYVRRGESSGGAAKRLVRAVAFGILGDRTIAKIKRSLRR